MENCLFCKIVANEIPAIKVYEDDEILAFLDVNPVNNGHTLVIPKEHYPMLSETLDDVAASLMRIIPQLSKAIMKSVDAKGFNLGVNNGKVASQSVDHTHLHIMPRFENDGRIPWHGKGSLDLEEGKTLANSIRANLQ